MAFSRVVGMTLLGAAMALPSMASAQAAAPPKNVDWSTINDSEPVVRVDAYGGYQLSTKPNGFSLGSVFGLRGAATFNHILHAGATATFYVPKAGTGFAWSPALEIGLDPPTGAFEIRPLVGAGVLLGFGEVLPTVYPGVIIGYRDRSRKFFIGGEVRLNVYTSTQLDGTATALSSLGVLGGYM
ncbi:MAG: hypothetical protein JWO86_3549 [Myxococcaceae bacterium]|nr:hypothetical protein [Myxococcaceae bacterium]